MNPFLLANLFRLFRIGRFLHQTLAEPPANIPPEISTRQAAAHTADQILRALSQPQPPPVKYKLLSNLAQIDHFYPNLLPTTTAPQPPPRGRRLQTPQTTTILASIIVGAGLCALAGVLLLTNAQAIQQWIATPTPEPAGDPIHLTLTWDEWTDLQGCILYSQTHITHTLQYVSSKTGARALHAYDRLDLLLNKVQDAGLDTESDYNPYFPEPFVDSIIDQMKEFQDLMFDLYEADLVHFAEEISQE